MLIVGLGGGSLPSLLRKHYPRMTIDVVDIDADVVAVAKKYFGFREDAAMHVYVEDGRRFIEKCKQPYDIIFLDAYGPENIPYDLATKEFLLACAAPWGPRGSWRATSGRKPAIRFTTPCCGPTRRPSTILYVVNVRDRGNEIFLALPRKEPIDRDDLARRASRLSKEEKFRFDVGEYVSEVFATRTRKTLTCGCCWTRTSRARAASAL